MIRNSILSLTLLVTLASCSSVGVGDVRKSLGVSKSAPDEFLVEPRDKLKLPKTAMALPVPQKEPEGAVAASDGARMALFGADAKNSSRPQTALEKSMAAKAGATDADPSIRRVVEKEHRNKTGVFGTERGGTMEALLDPFGYNKPTEPVVDGKKENQRIREALRDGQAISGEGAKTKDPANKEKVKKDGVI